MNRPIPSVDPEALGSFIPLVDLDRDALNMLSRTLSVEHAPPNHQLIELGSVDHWTLYLMEGKLSLTASDGDTHTIEAHTEAARLPISQLKPRIYSVRTLSPVQYLRIGDGVIENLLKQDHRIIAEAPESDGTDLNKSGLFFDICEDLNTDRLPLPNLPEVAIKIRKTVESDQSNATRIAKIVQSNPAIAAKLIKVANSPLYRRNSRFNTCAQAIVRIGTEATLQLVLSLTLYELFNTKSRELRQRMSELWKHSTHVAAISFVLARMTPGFDPEHALLAGLLHDIGLVPIITYAENYPQVTKDPARLNQVIEDLRGQVGSLILRKWDFSEDLVVTAAESQDWFRDPAPEPDYCDLVLIAQLHSYVGTARMQSLPRIDELPAFGKLALGKLNPDLSLKVLDEAQDRIAAARQLLEP